MNITGLKRKYKYISKVISKYEKKGRKDIDPSKMDKMQMERHNIGSKIKNLRNKRKKK